MNGIQSIASALLLLFVTMFATPVMAQEDGEKAGIHYIMFKMDEELMSDISISVNDRSFLKPLLFPPKFTTNFSMINFSHYCSPFSHAFSLSTNQVTSPTFTA